VAPPVAGPHNIFEDMPHNFVRQMSGEVFGAAVPKADHPIPVHEVNSDWQVFHQMPEQLRVVEEVRRHGWTRRLPVLSANEWGTSGARNEEGQGALRLFHSVYRTMSFHNVVRTTAVACPRFQ